MTHRVLLAVDGSVAADRATQYVVQLASRMPGVAAVVLSVQPEVHSGWVHEFLSQAQIDTALRAWGEETAAGPRARLEQEGIAVATRVAAGHPGEAIDSVARAERCDEIVMGARAMTRLGNFALGSVAADTVARASVPVTLLRESVYPERLYRKVLLAIEGSPASVRAARLVAARVSAFGPFEVRAINVQPAIEHWHRSAAEVDAAQSAAIERGRAACREACETVARAGVAVDFDVRFGDPAAAIVDEAASRGCDLIAMGTRGLGALAGLILGSVAFKTLHVASVPVTLVR